MTTHSSLGYSDVRSSRYQPSRQITKSGVKEGIFVSCEITTNSGADPAHYSASFTLNPDDNSIRIQGTLNAGTGCGGSNTTASEIYWAILVDISNTDYGKRWETWNSASAKGTHGNAYTYRKMPVMRASVAYTGQTIGGGPGSMFFEILGNNRGSHDRRIDESFTSGTECTTYSIPSANDHSPGHNIYYSSPVDIIFAPHINTFGAFYGDETLVFRLARDTTSATTNIDATITGKGLWMEEYDWQRSYNKTLA